MDSQNTRDDSQAGGLDAGAGDAQQGSFAPGGAPASAASESARQPKERAARLKGSIADSLERGAEALRTRVAPDGVDPAADGIVTTGDGAEEATKGFARAGTAVAARMERSAGWLRDADLGEIRTTVEKRMKSNPIPVFIAAVAVGVLLGAAFRKDRD